MLYGLRRDAELIEQLKKGLGVIHAGMAYASICVSPQI
jgi:hypothetical protein